MTDPAVMDALEALTDQLAEAQQRLAAQNAALVTLARYLAVRGQIDLPTLAQDLQTMGQSQPDAGWQAGLQELAGALMLAHGQQR